jgi:TonB family protein
MTTLDFVFGMTLFLAFQDRAYLALEKQAVVAVRQVPASQLDSQLPNRSFASWLSQQVGTQSGVIWQLTDCGEQTGNATDREREIPACVEAVAITPNDRKVFVNVWVGSSKLGVGQKPELYFAAVEHKGEFYTAKRLSDLPGLLTKPLKPKTRPVTLPDVQVKQSQPVVSAFVRSAPIAMTPPPSTPVEIQPPLAPSRGASAKPTYAALGEVVTKVTPEYPITARQIAVTGEVQVRVLVSEQGNVLEAKAVSGTALFRRSAEIAASKWVFKPAMLNGKPAKAEGTIIFIFTRN